MLRQFEVVCRSRSFSSSLLCFIFHQHWKFALGEHPFIVTQEIFKNGPVMENCLLGLESKQLYFGWSEALEPI